MILFVIADWRADQIVETVLKICIHCCVDRAVPFLSKQLSLLRPPNARQTTRRSTFSWMTEVAMVLHLVRILTPSLRMQSTQLAPGDLDQE
jgi:hypothetical protein